MSSPFRLCSHPFPTLCSCRAGMLFLAVALFGHSIAARADTYVWVANQADYNAGTVSKISTTTNREVARYPSVTCRSDPVNGSNETAVFGNVTPASLCSDGAHGCCSRAESVPGANNGHEPVNVYGNRPSATAVDLNGDAWVANIADYPDLAQASVTKIAGTLALCVERNGAPGIQTSTDVNGDGHIDTDCNDNGIPDSLTDVAGQPCKAGRFQEFHGLDDECVLFTVNTGPIGQRARALALGPGVTASDPADAWVATYADGKYYRIDGATGAIKTTVVLAAQDGVAAHPFSAAVDRFGILWSNNIDCDSLGGCLFYFDTNNTSNQDMVRSGLGGQSFFGIALDGFRQNGVLVQQIWLGEYGGYGAYRFRPVRNAGFAAIRTGTWARAAATNASAVTQGLGVAVSNRGNGCAWVAFDGNYTTGNGKLARFPADMADGLQTFPDPSTIIATTQTGTVGVAITDARNIWAVNQASSSVSHVVLDAGANLAAVQQVNLDTPVAFPHAAAPYTFSDFSGFGYRNFTRADGDTLLLDGFDGSCN